MLTDTKIRRLKPKEREYIISDDDRSRGRGRLVLRVRPSGAKTWEYRYFQDGRRRKAALGSFPALGLAAAREEARRLAEARSAGETPRRAVGPADAGAGPARETATSSPAPQPEEPPARSLGELLEAYIQDLHERKCRTAVSVESSIRTWVLKTDPALWEKPANAVTPTDVRDLLAYHSERGMTTGVNRLRSYLVSAYRFAARHDYSPLRRENEVWRLSENPASIIPRISSFERPGERVLSSDEVAHLYQHIGTPASTREGARLAVQLAVSTAGQRPAMLLRLRRSHIDFERRCLDIPGAETKNGRPHVVPFVGLSEQVVCELARRADDAGRDVLFPGNPRYGQETYGLQSLMRAMRTYRKTFGRSEIQVRDVRRTAKTVMGQLGVSKDRRDRLQGHTPTDISTRHYDRYDYLAEKREALEVWDSWLRSHLGD